MFRKPQVDTRMVTGQGDEAGKRDCSEHRCHAKDFRSFPRMGIFGLPIWT